jgi:hypothetical protein
LLRAFCWYDALSQCSIVYVIKAVRKKFNHQPVTDIKFLCSR